MLRSRSRQSGEKVSVRLRRRLRLQRAKAHRRSAAEAHQIHTLEALEDRMLLSSTVVTQDDLYTMEWNELLHVTDLGLLDNDTNATGSEKVIIVEGPKHGSLSTAADDFSVVLLPDTQIYTNDYSYIFDAQTQWIMDQRAERNISFVGHLGDIVDNPGSALEWISARRAIKTLGEQLPYGLVVGNHDMLLDGTSPKFEETFPLESYEDVEWYGGRHANGKNSYQFFSAGGDDYIVFSLEYAPPNYILDWVDGLLTQHADKRAMITTHGYLTGDGERTTELNGNREGENTGEDIWNAVIVNHDNVEWVMAGHHAVSSWRADTVGNRTIYQMLSDFQRLERGGDGFLRILDFKVSENKVYASTYSPTIDAYLTDSSNQFVMDYNMSGEGGGFNYRPDVDFNGIDTFTYMIEDANGQSNVATATIQVLTRQEIDFSKLTFQSYSGQDGQGTATVANNGATLNLEGNRWRAARFDYVVTPNTVIEFDFSSSQEGEIHAIGLDNNLTSSPEYRFQLYGTQDTSGTTDFVGVYPPVAPAVQHYVIPIGDYFIGQMHFFTFINDDDSGVPTAQSTFSNLVIGERPSVSVDPGVDVTFEAASIVSYGVNQDTNGSAVVEDGGNALRLTGNTWKAHAFNYTVTAATVVEFDFASPSQGEIHALGFDDDLLTTPAQRFDLYGTQTGSGVQAYNDYADTAPGVKHYVIPIGQFFSGNINYLYFANDHDVANPTGQAVFSNLRVYEGQAVPVGEVNFNAVPIQGYGSQDGNGSAVVEDNGDTLHLSGNTWKAITINYDVTASTVLEFDFASPAQAEIHAVGFDDNFSPTPQQRFDLYGTQSGSGIQVYNNYDSSAPGTKHYLIQVGQFFTGQMTYLFFANDHDIANPTSESFFSNVRLYEDETPPAGDTIDFNLADVRGYGSQDVNGTATIEDDGATLHLSGNTWKTITVDYEITADTVLEFDFQSSFQGEINAVGFDNDLFPTPTWRFDLYGVQTGSGLQMFNNYGADAPFVKHYKINVGEFFTGTFKYLFFANDHDVANPTAQALYSNVKLYENIVIDTGVIVFDENAFTPYVESTPEGTMSLEDGNTTLHLTGDQWHAYAVNYNITADTVLEFDFTSPVKGDFHAIGFDNDLLSSPETRFVLYGTQLGTGLTDYRDYSQTAPGTRHYTIPVGLFFTGPMEYITFINDDDTGVADAESFFSNVRIHDVQRPSPSEGLDLNLYRVEVYGDPTTQLGTHTINTAGDTIQLDGNISKSIGLNYTITPDTVIEFDYSSAVRGDFQGIGFDVDYKKEHPHRLFQLYGSKLSDGITDFFNYAASAPGTAHYVIPVGDYYTGDITHLFFTNDHAVSPSPSQAIFSNIRIYERQVVPFFGGPVDFSAVDIDPYANDAATGGTHEVLDGGDTIRLTGDTSVAVRLDYLLTANTVLEFDFTSANEGFLHSIGMDTDRSNSTQFQFDLYGTSPGSESIGDFYNYAAVAPTTTHYIIPIGEYYTGKMNYLFLENEGFFNGTNESIFSNVQIYESV